MTKKTLFLFIIAVFLTAGSFILNGKGRPEIFPFFAWKLFTRPSGATESESQYRIYGIRNNDTVRIAIRASKLFDENEKAAFLNQTGQKIESGNSFAKEKLSVFAKTEVGKFEDFLLVKETYNPHFATASQIKIKKEIVCRFR